MKKCEHTGCNNLIEEGYHFCYQHRKDRYKDTCKIHGEQDFILGQCQKCKQLKQPIYRIYYRNKKYYAGKSKKALPTNYYLKPFYKLLINKNINYHKQFIGNITNQPGIYGIFVRDRKKKDGLGKCLYVGQSVNIKNRVGQHKRNFVIASNHIKGLKAHNKGIIVIPKYKVEYKYYIMAGNYYLKDLKFVSLYKISPNIWKKFSSIEQKECLCFLEQNAMDVYKPQLNTFASRLNYN